MDVVLTEGWRYLHVSFEWIWLEFCSFVILHEYVEVRFLGNAQVLSYSSCYFVKSNIIFMYANSIRIYKTLNIAESCIKGTPII